MLPIDTTRRLSVSSNEQVAKLCAECPRFVGFASVDPLKPGAAKKLEFAVLDKGHVMTMHTSSGLLVTEGIPCLQTVYFMEYDGPLERTYTIQILGE